MSLDVDHLSNKKIPEKKKENNTLLLLFSNGSKVESAFWRRVEIKLFLHNPWYCTTLHTGQTGSGKTYTMLGDSSDLATAAGEGTAGLIPRICVELFQRFGPVGGGGAVGASRCAGQASIQVSFCEVRSALQSRE